MSGWFPDLGLANIYGFLRDSGRLEEPDMAERKISAAGGHRALRLPKRRISGSSAICVKALDLFVSVYGAEAGNLALRARPPAVFISAAASRRKSLPSSKMERFMRAFLDKGRYLELLSGMPVRVILNDQAALQGAAFYAVRFHKVSSSFLRVEN